MNEFRLLAAKIDQHMQQLFAQGVNEDHAIISRMMGYVPDLHKIWIGSTDQQLLALSQEFPGFYRYALIMEEASEAERNKASRPYDDLAEFSEEHKQRVVELLSAAATIERGYNALHGHGNTETVQQKVNELSQLYEQWLVDLGGFKDSLRAQGAGSKTLEYVNEAFERLVMSIEQQIMI
jgi:hypothetical protein